MKENELQVVNTINDKDGIRLVLSDGSSAIISKINFVNAIGSYILKPNHILDYIDCNTIKSDRRISGYKWLNAPVSSIAILEVLTYSNDWIIQKFIEISSSPCVWIRSWHHGNTWGEWVKL